MKHHFIVLLLTVSLLLAGCIPGNQPTEPTYCPTGNVAPCMVKINGTEYIIWGNASDTVPNEDAISGKITSVKANNAPFTADDQANFPDALDQPYAFVGDQVLILIKGKWCICTPMDSVK